MGDSLARSLPIMRLGCSSSTSHGELGGVPHAGCAASRCSCAQGDAMPTGAVLLVCGAIFQSAVRNNSSVSSPMFVVLTFFRVMAASGVVIPGDRCPRIPIARDAACAQDVSCVVVMRGCSR